MEGGEDELAGLLRAPSRYKWRVLEDHGVAAEVVSEHAKAGVGVGPDESHATSLREKSRFATDVRPLSSWRGPQAALKRSYRGDRVTRDWPVALRVRAAKSGTRIVLWTGHLCT